MHLLLYSQVWKTTAIAALLKLLVRELYLSSYDALHVGSCTLLFHCCAVYYTRCNSCRKPHCASPRNVDLDMNPWKFVTLVRQAGALAKVNIYDQLPVPESKPSKGKISSHVKKN